MRKILSDKAKKIAFNKTDGKFRNWLGFYKELFFA